MASAKSSISSYGKVLALGLLILLASMEISGQRTQKPVLHGRHWMAITGKPLAATAGAKIFERGGNAVDAAWNPGRADGHAG